VIISHINIPKISVMHIAELKKIYAYGKPTAEKNEIIVTPLRNY